MTHYTRTKHSPADVTRVISLFFGVRRVMRTILARGKKLDPSTWLRIETMKFIAEHDKPKMKELADYLSITAPSATSLANGLVKSGLVSCDSDRRDRRTSRLALTAKGKMELKKATTRGVALLSGLFSTLSAAEFAAFTDALEQMKKTETDYANPGK